MGDASTGDAIFEELGNAASVMCYFGSCFPQADLIGAMIPRGVGGPCGISEASSLWRAGADGLQQLQQTLRTLTESLPAGSWSGDDRDGFDTEIRSLLAELGDSHNTAEAVGIALEVLPPFFALWPSMGLTMGIGIATIAASFYAAAASVVGDLGAAEADYAMGEAFTAGCFSVISVSSELLIGLLALAQGVIVAAVAADVTTQEQHGNSAILGDLGQAEVDGLGEVAANAAQLAASYGLDKGAEHVGGETPEVPKVLGGPLGGLVRGANHTPQAIAHGAAGQVDVGQHQAAERALAGESLQDLINDMSGWDGAASVSGDDPGPGSTDG